MGGRGGREGGREGREGGEGGRKGRGGREGGSDGCYTYSNRYVPFFFMAPRFIHELEYDAYAVNSTHT